MNNMWWLSIGNKGNNFHGRSARGTSQGVDFIDEMNEASPGGAAGRSRRGVDSWTPVTTSDAPDGRENHIAVWTGKEMIIWGGDKIPPERYPDFEFLNSGGRYCTQNHCADPEDCSYHFSPLPHPPLP